MRLKVIRAKDTLPVKQFAIGELSDVVVIAGRNGVGKTRLLQAVINSFQNPVGQVNVNLIVEATCQEERERWNKDTLDTANRPDAELLLQTLQESRFRRNWKSSVVNIESDRSIQKLNPYQFSFDVVDPDEEAIGWNFTFGGLRNRYQDTIHSIFRKVHSYRNKISSKAEQLMRRGEKTMDLNFPDPLEPFKHAFRQLLAPKELLDADLRAQQLEYTYQGQKFHINSLSSGEREVVNIVFDFILRNPSDCIVFFDEPELHLHPELSYKLIQTLSSLGTNNQFIFCTHSPDIITASLEHTVVFIGPPKEDGSNQAIPVSEDDETNQALRLLGQSVGVIALGKKIVLIEGGHSSLDKQTYGAILKDRFPDLVMVPSGGKGLIRSFSTLAKEVLEKSIWGVEFYMLCDRDVIPPSRETQELEEVSKGKLKVLDRYHLENYFLEESILVKVFESIEAEDSWLRSEEAIKNELIQIAQSMISYATSLYTSAHFREAAGNVDIMTKNCHEKNIDELTSLILQKTNEEQRRIHKILDQKEIESFTRETATMLNNSLSDGTDGWKRLIPGKQVLNVFAGKANLTVGRLKRAYINEAMKAEHNPFSEIIDIFDHFDKQLN